MSLENILLQIGAPILAKVIGQRFGKDAADIAQVGIEALAESFGVEPTREAVEAAIKPNQTTSVAKVQAAEAKMPELLLAQAEVMRRGNEQQALTNQLQRDAMSKGPLWTWAWLYVWQYVLMFLWVWALILVHLVNAGVRILGSADAAVASVMPAPAVPDMLALTTLYLGLHMGGHTVLELMRGKWGRANQEDAS